MAFSVFAKIGRLFRWVYSSTVRYVRIGLPKTLEAVGIDWPWSVLMSYPMSSAVAIWTERRQISNLIVTAVHIDMMNFQDVVVLIIADARQHRGKRAVVLSVCSRKTEAVSGARSAADAWVLSNVVFIYGA